MDGQGNLESRGKVREFENKWLLWSLGTILFLLKGKEHTVVR